MPKAKPNPAPKKPRKPKVQPVTTLQIVPKQEKAKANAHSSQTRRKFLDAYEMSGGNISASCEAAGIARLTYYRWLESPTRVNVKFRERIARLKPEERVSDVIEGMFLKRVMEGSDPLIKFGLERKVKGRGWEVAETFTADAITKLLDAFQSVLKEKPDMSDAERSMWIKDFADSGGVPEETLARKIRVLELTGGK